MNMEEMLKNVDPNKLNSMLQKLEGVLTPQQMKQVRQTVQGGNPAAVQQKIKQCSAEDLKRELEKNPALARQLAANPEIMNQLNHILGKK